VRQGCPLSPYLFVLVLECLAARIRAQPVFTGIAEPLSGTKNVQSMFADDCTVFLTDLQGMMSLRDEIFFFEMAQVRS